MAPSSVTDENSSAATPTPTPFTHTAHGIAIIVICAILFLATVCGLLFLAKTGYTCRRHRKSRLENLRSHAKRRRRRHFGTTGRSKFYPFDLERAEGDGPSSALGPGIGSSRPAMVQDRGFLPLGVVPGEMDLMAGARDVGGNGNGNGNANANANAGGDANVKEKEQEREQDVKAMVVEEKMKAQGFVDVPL